ncbi:MAG: hypothetical protein PVSMB1_02830 [Gemmatimonadaceae bacterium]
MARRLSARLKVQVVLQDGLDRLDAVASIEPAPAREGGPRLKLEPPGARGNQSFPIRGPMTPSRTGVLKT